jgi:hypothetical protein
MSHEDMNRDDNHDVEQRLRAALRPVDPGAGFVGGVMARIAAERLRSARPPRTRAGWLTFALAASIVLALLVAHQQQARRTQQGLEARRQLIQALRVAGDKLDLASRIVNAQQPPPNSSNSGA